LTLALMCILLPTPVFVAPPDSAVWTPKIVTHFPRHPARNSQPPRHIRHSMETSFDCAHAHTVHVYICEETRGTSTESLQFFIFELLFPRKSPAAHSPSTLE